ncbi:MAG: polymer-forming cytoskeletal protein [Alphaproteobacteria bacterium]|nr:polymer-forming cytoskeletal protein [Alphaproteobacteria bacterium]MBV9692182.1 polymer-forming cytoskeletal protein [Alphaproteobacteria bacterium]
MTMFTRNDKGQDTASPATAQPVRSDAQPAASPVAETRRPQAQPISSSSAAHGTPSVSVISKALKITGQLESTEDIQIEGEIEGDVRAVSVMVGANAKVKGTVRGDQVQLAGQVEGKIEAKKVILTRTARMSGDVVHQDITIESGAFIDGHCRPEYGKAEVKAPGLKTVVAGS